MKQPPSKEFYHTRSRTRHIVTGVCRSYSSYGHNVVIRANGNQFDRKLKLRLTHSHTHSHIRSLTHSLTHSFTHSLTQSLINSHTHSHTHSLIHTLTHS